MALFKMLFVIELTLTLQYQHKPQGKQCNVCSVKDTAFISYGETLWYNTFTPVHSVVKRVLNPHCTSNTGLAGPKARLRT